MTDLADLVRALPFPLDDLEAAGEAFAAGRGGNAERRAHASVWTYAYIRRYFRRAFAHETTGSPSDADAAEDRAHRGAEDATVRVQDPFLYPRYVNVVCRHALLTQRGRRRRTVEADDTTLVPVLDDGRVTGDGASVWRDAEQAIGALPPAIRDVARMKCLDGMPYDAIAQATGHPLPTVRTYASKASARLVRVPELRAHFYDDVLPPGAGG